MRPLELKFTESLLPLILIDEAIERSFPVPFERVEMLDRLGSAAVASVVLTNLPLAPSLAVLMLEGPLFLLEVPAFLHLSLLGILPYLPRDADVGGLGSTSILHTGQVFAFLNQVYQVIEK